MLSANFDHADLWEPWGPDTEKAVWWSFLELQTPPVNRFRGKTIQIDTFIKLHKRSYVISSCGATGEYIIYTYVYDLISLNSCKQTWSALQKGRTAVLRFQAHSLCSYGRHVNNNMYGSIWQWSMVICRCHMSSRCPPSPAKCSKLFPPRAKIRESIHVGDLERTQLVAAITHGSAAFPKSCHTLYIKKAQWCIQNNLV